MPVLYKSPPRKARSFHILGMLSAFMVVVVIEGFVAPVSRESKSREYAAGAVGKHILKPTSTVGNQNYTFLC